MIAAKVPESRFVNKRRTVLSQRVTLLSGNFAAAKLGRKTEGKVCN